MQKMFQTAGIHHQTSIPHNAQQNGRAERAGRTVMEKARCMIAESRVSKSFWPEAIATAAYCSNRSPKESLDGITPFQVWFGRNPDLSHLRIFGSQCYAYIPSKDREKMEDVTEVCLFLGYCSNQMGYRLWSQAQRVIFSSRDVVLNESKPTHAFIPMRRLIKSTDNPPAEHQNQIDLSSQSRPGTSCNFGNKPEMEVDHDKDRDQEGVRPADLKPTRNRRPPTWHDQYVMSSFPHQNHQTQDTVFVPKSYKESLNCPDAQFWIDAMKQEYETIIKNGTWKLVDLPPDANLIGTRWLYRVKKTENGSLKYKARLVAQGCSQKPGVDYDEIFSPVAKFATLRILFALATLLDLQTGHIDFDSAYLQGELDKEVYVRQPQGFIRPGNERLVCLLHKALYGLKQSGRKWNIKLHNLLTALGLKQSVFDLCLYYDLSIKQIFLVAVWVDDVFVFYNTQASFDFFLRKLQEEYSVKNLGEIKNCLGISVTRDRVNGRITLSQPDYVSKVVQQYNLEQAEPSTLPMEPGVELYPDLSQKTPEEIEKLSKIPYQNAIGAVMYLLQCTRPDIAFPVSLLSRFCTTYSNAHWKCLKKVICYLKGTSNLGITFSRDGCRELIGSCDASYASDKTDYKSMTGYIYTMAGRCITWRCTKQKNVAKSSSEAELQSLSDCASEAKWLKGFLEELSAKQIDMPITIFCDNKAAINFGENANLSHALKHVNVDYRFIHEYIKRNIIKLSYVPTNRMIADSFTKAVKFD